MVYFERFVALSIIIGVLQVCTCSPIAPGVEKDVTKLFTADELQRARSVGIKDQHLMNAISRGVSVDELIKLSILQKSEPVTYADSNDNDTTPPSISFAETTKLCDIFVPDFKPATNYSRAQEIRLNEAWRALDDFPRNIQFLFLRNSVCPYGSQPFQIDECAATFGSKFISFMKFRFWMLKTRNSTGVERVNTVRQVCCAYQGQYNKEISELKVEPTSFSLSNDQMTKFNKLWNDFQTANTSQSFDQVCNFLQTCEKCRSN